MNVYVLIRHESYEGSTMYGVYSSQDLAEKAQVTYSDAEIEEWELDAHKELLEAGARLYCVRWMPNMTCIVEHTSYDADEPPIFAAIGMLITHTWAATPMDAACQTRHHAEKISEEGKWPTGMGGINKWIESRKRFGSDFDILDAITIIQEKP